MKNLSLLLIAVVFTQSCAQIKTAKLANISKECLKTKTIEITKDFCKTIDSPEVHFVVKIPECLDYKPAISGEKNHSYIKAEKHDKNNVLKQMLTIGHLKTSDKGKAFEKSALSFLKQINKC